MQRASTHYGCCDAHELSTHGHCGATARWSPESDSPFKDSGPLANFHLPATAFVCLTFAVCRVTRRMYIPATSMTPSFFASTVMRLWASYLFQCPLSVRNNIRRADAAGRPGSSRRPP
jgi:hypothetical protein